MLYFHNERLACTDFADFFFKRSTTAFTCALFAIINIMSPIVYRKNVKRKALWTHCPSLKSMKIYLEQKAHVLKWKKAN